jgi:hypothetical protein
MPSALPFPARVQATLANLRSCDWVRGPTSLPPPDEAGEAELALVLAIAAAERGDFAGAEQELHDAHLNLGNVLPVGDELEVGALWQEASRARDAALVGAAVERRAVSA